MNAPWYRKPICMAGLCHTFRFASNEDGCWGECCVCLKRVGYVDRATLRLACDAEAEHSPLTQLEQTALSPSIEAEIARLQEQEA